MHVLKSSQLVIRRHDVNLKKCRYRKKPKNAKNGDLEKILKLAKKIDFSDLKGSQGLVLKRMGSRLTLNWAFIGDSVNYVSDVKKPVKIPLYIRKS